MSKTRATPTLVEHARDLRIKIERIASADKDQEVLRVFETVKEDLQAHRDRITTLLTSVNLLRGESIVPDKGLVHRGKLGGLHRKIETLSKRLRSERSQLTAQNTWASCNKEAGELADALQERLQTHWTQFVTEHTGKVETFVHFRSLEGCAAAISEIEREAATLRAAGAGLPARESDIAKVRKGGARIDKLIEVLDLGDVPKAVQEFLKRASQEGAPLGDLTDEVLSWLRKKKLLGGLRVRAGTSKLR